LSDSGQDPAGRHQRLLSVALEALVADHADPALKVSSASPAAFGAALVGQGSGGVEAWVMLDTRDRDPAASLGAVLAWALRAEVAHLSIVTDMASATLARRAAQFDFQVATFRREGRSLHLLEPTALTPPSAPDPRHLQFADLITDAGAVLSVEHSVVAGEVRGLEVCRVVDDPTGAARLEVGVGANDRLAFSMLYEGEPTEVSLRRVVSEVQAHRSIGAARHPLNQLAKERFLRWHLEQHPELLGLDRLVATAGPIPRVGLAIATPCTATGRDQNGCKVHVVCSVGIDLDLVPYASDVRLAQTRLTQTGSDETQRLILVVPTRDLIPLQVDLAARLARHPQWSPAEVMGLDWPSP
jgi:hypothetical protein